MKTKLILFLVLPLSAFAAQGRFGAATPAGAAGQRGPGTGDCTATCPLDAISAANPTTLPAADLVFGIEEERVARDVYTAAFERWQLPVFQRIARAETQHETAFTQLAATVNTTLPAAVRGTYATAELQRIYAQLIALVNESEVAALRAGALVEETDLADLRRMKTVAKDDATLAVLANLEQASVRHLNAFVRNLAQRGESYQPQVLTAADYAALLAANPGRGRRW